MRNLWSFFAGIYRKARDRFSVGRISMKLHSIYLFRVAGISGLPDELANWTVWESGSRSATLTTNIDKYAEIVDSKNAIASALLTGLFRPEASSASEVIGSAISAARAARKQNYPGGAFLVFKAEEDSPEPDLATSRNFEDFVVAFDAIDRRSLERRHEQDLKTCLAAVALLLDDQVDHAIIQIGQASYLSAGKGSKPIFTFTSEALALRMSQARVIRRERLEESSTLVGLLKADRAVNKIINLYLQSVGESDDFRAFFSGWNALEMFVNRLFSELYGPLWLKELRAKMPASAAPYFDIVEQVMSGKHRLVDKFAVIATSVSAETALVDTAELKSLKRIRDDIIHGSGLQATFPAERAQRLLRRYLELHLKREIT